MPFIRRIVYSTPGRVLIPLILVGASGVAINMISEVITTTSYGIIKSILATRWTLVFCVSSALLTLYEMKRIAKDINRQKYVNSIVQQLQPDIIEACKQKIKEGKIQEAIDNINIASKLLKPSKID